MTTPSTPIARQTRHSSAAALAACALALACAAWQMPAHAAAAADSHAGHTLGSGQQHSVQNYSLPAVKLTRGDGKRMSLAEAIDDGRPVMLNFIYTSCNAICPVTSQVFVEFRERLGSVERDKINMVSISIDPEQDTPRRLTAYAKRFGSAGTWSHYTSSSADAIEIQRAFGAWRGDKMNHQPTTWLRVAPGKPWQRYDGFIGPEQLVQQYLALMGGADVCIEPSSKMTSTSGNGAAALAGVTPRSKP
jgi:protein SCO1/2